MNKESSMRHGLVCFSVGVFSLLALCLAQSASAVVMRHDYYDPLRIDVAKELRYLTLANQARFAAVGAFVFGTRAERIGNENPRFCSGTLIGQHTVLTAAHCFSLPGDVRSQKELENITFVFGPDVLQPS